MVSGDGYQRERAVRSLRLRPLTVRLVVLRCVDWVAEVRDAALDRLDECESRLLVAALPLAEQLARERVRGKILSSLLDASLPDEDLRHAYRLSDPRTRRAAWRRLRARGVTRADELLGVAARDPDVVVRGIAVSSLMHLSGADKRFLAGVLVNDRVGSVAVPALAALVELDGAQPIHTALTGRSPSLRRAARDWAAIRGVDARGVYLQRLADDHRDAIALTALAEMGDPQDVELFKQMLAGDRSRVRAAGLRALARVDRSAGRRTALTALQAGTNGRMTWTAADVLGDGRLSDTELRAIAGVATDSTRTPGQRFRALSLLRGSPWVHLAALLQARQDAGDENFHRRLDRELRVWISRSGKVSRGPHPDLRTQIEQLVSTIDAQARTEIAFVLRTTQ
jgi:HEAT repeat protein